MIDSAHLVASAWLGWLDLPAGEVAWVVGAVFLASVVRGFSGFALSALIMATLVGVLPPIALIPVCFILEVGASLLMVRGGLRAADFGIVAGLFVGGLVGVPFGLSLTRLLEPDSSRLLALATIVCLAALQLARVTPAWLATRPGLVGAGVLAGTATGIASVGGMVIALYTLARGLPAARTRATLVMYLCVGMLGSGFWLIVTGVLTDQALRRGLALTPLVLVGVLIGGRLFDPTRQTVYRQVCLWLLIGLAVTGLMRHGLARLV